MCVWCLESSKLTAGKLHDTPVGDELCTAYSDCSGIAKNYLYACLQRNSVLFIYMFSKKLGPIYIHVFTEIRYYLYTCVQRN
jgi:hypothetical protein